MRSRLRKRFEPCRVRPPYPARGAPAPALPLARAKTTAYFTYLVNRNFAYA